MVLTKGWGKQRGKGGTQRDGHRVLSYSWKEEGPLLYEGTTYKNKVLCISVKQKRAFSYFQDK